MTMATTGYQLLRLREEGQDGDGRRGTGEEWRLHVQPVCWQASGWPWLLAAGCCPLLCSALLNVYFLTKPSDAGSGLQKRNFVYPIKEF